MMRRPGLIRSVLLAFAIGVVFALIPFVGLSGGFR
jgi:uncharacterized protein (DUF2062 family)